MNKQTIGLIVASAIGIFAAGFGVCAYTIQKRFNSPEFEKEFKKSIRQRLDRFFDKNNLDVIKKEEN